MDVVTHALLGATAARAAAGPRMSRTSLALLAPLSVREAVVLGAVAGAFPDIDFAAFLIDPLRFLADWHQGPTHSLLLVPLWALLLAVGYVALTRRRDVFGAAAAVCAIGVASHIASDLITAYGTAVLWPLSDARPSLATTFVIDPLFTLIVAVGLAVSLYGDGRRAALAALAAVAIYVAAQAWIKQSAIAIGNAEADRAGLPAGSIVALPQPFSPLNWKLVHAAGDRYHEAYVNVARHGAWIPVLPALRRWHEMASAYRPPAQVQWRERHRFGDVREWRTLAEERWNDPAFEDFRRFAALPAVSRIDAQGQSLCVWFTDLRYDLPALPDTFRYGFCRDADRPWRLYRLRYFSESARQPLSR